MLYFALRAWASRYLYELLPSAMFPVVLRTPRVPFPYLLLHTLASRYNNTIISTPLLVLVSRRESVTIASILPTCDLSFPMTFEVPVRGSLWGARQSTQTVQQSDVDPSSARGRDNFVLRCALEEVAGRPGGVSGYPRDWYRSVS